MLRMPTHMQTHVDRQTPAQFGMLMRNVISDASEYSVKVGSKVC